MYYTAAYTDCRLSSPSIYKYLEMVFISIGRANKFSALRNKKKENTKNCPLNLFIKNNWQNQNKK